MDQLTSILIAASLSAITSVIIGLRIGLYIRYNTKPTHEKIYDDNRHSNISIIFDQIDFFDRNLQGIFNRVEKDFGELSRDRKTFVPDLFDENNVNQFPPLDVKKIDELQKKFELRKPNLDARLKAMKKVSENFQADYTIFQNYVHEYFIRYVKSYYFDAVYYVELLLQNELEPSSLIDRMKYAKDIVDYIESDKSITKNGNIKIFVDKWKETMKQYPDLIIE